MALYKRKKTWWTDFSVNGVRYRVSLDTSDWREAQSREKERIAEAQAGKLSIASQSFARLAFTEALDRYLADRAMHVAACSHHTESDHAKPLREYFAATPVSRISSDAILALIRQRKEKGISNVTINMEIGILRRVLKRAKRWAAVADEVPRLPERRDVGRALTHEEKVRLAKTAASKPEWQVARLAMTLALNTTMRGCELKGLRWRDVNLLARSLTVRRSKTEAGERHIPLNADAFVAILECRERIKAFYGVEPQQDWYVFPSGEGQGPRIGTNKTTVKPDPTKPMVCWRSAWRSLTRAAGLRGLRFHDLRHHAITELAEGQASDGTIRSIAGHVSQRMLEHYSHIRMDAKRKALDALSGRDSTEGYGTNNDTNSQTEPVPIPQVIEKNGGDDGTRTRDLCRDRVGTTSTSNNLQGCWGLPST